MLNSPFMLNSVIILTVYPEFTVDAEFTVYAEFCSVVHIFVRGRFCKGTGCDAAFRFSQESRDLNKEQLT